MTILHNPPNTRPIDHVWAIISVDETGEGICAGPIAGVFLPFVTGDEALLRKRMMPVAREIATRTGKTLKVVKFTTREEVEEILP